MDNISTNQISQSRWRSPILWAAIIVQIFLIFDGFGVYARLGVERSELSAMIDAVLQLLVIVGVLNNPTDKVNW